MNIISYAKKSGNLNFKERSFSRVDSLVFAQLSYLVFHSSYFRRKKTVRIGDLCGRQFIKKLTADTLEPKKNIALIKALSASARFKDVTVSNFVEDSSDQKLKQFAAMTMSAEDFVYVAFRGTDISINGWKEDLQLALYSTIPSQEAAKEYLERIFPTLLLSSHIYIGGHSKGGNLAVYASTFVSSAYQSRIERVFDHDGPGFKKEIFNQPEFLSISDRVDRTLPHNSVVGILLNYYSPYLIVKSHAISGLYQHDPFNWTIGRSGDFITYKSRTKSSVALEKSLSSWLDSTDDKRRAEIVEKIFNLFDTAKIHTVKELKKKVFHLYKTFKKMMLEEADDTQHEIHNIINNILRLYLYNRFGLFKLYKRRGVAKIKK